MSDQERLQYERYQTDLHHQASIYESTYVLGEIQGVKKGIKKGIEQGVEQEKKNSKKEMINIIKNMTEQGFDEVMIAKLTGISVEKIRKILSGRRYP